MLLIGTRKGLWLLAADEGRSSWSVARPMFLGHIIQHAVLDPRDRRALLAASRTGHLGPTVFRSTDLGATWHEASSPPAFTTGDTLGRALQAVFWLTPGHFGTTSGEVWTSADEGETWQQVLAHLPEIYSVEVCDPVERA